MAWGEVCGKADKKYVDHVHVKSWMCGSTEDEAEKEMVEYIKRQTNEVWYPDAEHVKGYMEGSYVSMYEDGLIKGCIVGRRVEVSFEGERYRGYYNEVMASDSDTVSRRLISTHEENKNKNKNKKSVTVFSSCARIMFVLPVVKYEVRWVQTVHYKRYKVGCSVVKVCEGNMSELVNELEGSSLKFKMYPSIEQLVAQVRCKLLSVYYVCRGPKIIGIIFLKKALMVDHNKSVIDCCGVLIKEKEEEKEEVGKAFSNIMARFKVVHPIVRLHVTSDVGKLPSVPYYKRSETFVYLYGYKSRVVGAEEALIL
jgi:hypothetical protein